MKTTHPLSIILLVLLFIIVALLVNVLLKRTPAPSAPSTPSTPVVEDTSIGLQTEILKEGEGDVATTGDQISVHYIGTLTDGTPFDSSRDRGTPFTLTLGTGSVIKGWEEGLVGMKVGELRRLTIPAELGYGDRAVSTIPANSTLIFEVELLSVQHPE